MIYKITNGYVVQQFEDGKCVAQDFVAEDSVEYEDEDGNPTNPPKNEQYFPFDMIQPEEQSLSFHTLIDRP